MLRPSVLLDAAVLLAIAVAGKLLSAYGAAGTRSDGLLIGIGMVPHGEVGLIFASIGLAQGVLDDEALRRPPARRAADDGRRPAGFALADGMRSRRHHSGRRRRRSNRMPVGCRPRRRACSTAGRRQAPWCPSPCRPPPSPVTALGRAALVVRRAPRRVRGPVATPSPCSTCSAAVDHGRSRLLDVTGVLQRGVQPSRPARSARRRADPSKLDPFRVLRFPTITHVDELLDESAPLVPRPAIVKFAALVLDILGPNAPRRSTCAGCSTTRR